MTIMMKIQMISLLGPPIESNTPIALSYNVYNYANSIFIAWVTFCNSRNDWKVIDNKCMCRDLRMTWKQKGFDDSSSDRLPVVPWKVRLQEYTLPRCSSICSEYNTSATFRGNRLTRKSNSLNGGRKQSWWRRWTRLYTSRNAWSSQSFRHYFGGRIKHRIQST